MKRESHQVVPDEDYFEGSSSPLKTMHSSSSRDRDESKQWAPLPVPKNRRGQPKPRQRVDTQLQIARETIKSFGQDNLIFCRGKFHLWSDCIWKEVDQQAICQRILQVFERHSQISKISTISIKSIFGLMSMEVFQASTIFDNPITAINCLNGELHFENGSWLLKPHLREHYWLSVIPVNYAVNAVSRRFDQFLAEIFLGDPDAAEKKKCVQQFMGYSLTTDCSLEKYIMLIGSGSNGKSVLLAISMKLIGNDNIAAVSPEQFDNKFQRAHLQGKLANVITELRQGLEINDAGLKSVVSGELTTAEQKYCPPFNFRPYAKHWFATNHLPNTRDATFAFFRRALIIEFNNSFTGERCDPNLTAALEEELAGILNFALAGLSSLFVEKSFTEPESSKAAKSTWKIDSDQVALFISEACKTGPNLSITASALYDGYRSWCESSGVSKPLSKNMFGRRLSAISGIKRTEGNNNVRLYHNVELNF